MPERKPGEFLPKDPRGDFAAWEDEQNTWALTEDATAFDLTAFDLMALKAERERAEQAFKAAARRPLGTWTLNMDTGVWDEDLGRWYDEDCDVDGYGPYDEED